MGLETAEWYNNFCLIGHTDKRGKSWHYQEAMQGDEPNHYPGAIPYNDVVRRLFNWKPMLTRTANMIPCKRSHDEEGKDIWEPAPQLWVPKLDASGDPVMRDGRVVNMPMVLHEVPDMRGIVRDDNYLELGHASAKYKIHDFEGWLLQLLSNVIGDTLDIWSAILLRNGAQACVQVALPETAHDSTTGMDFVPYVHCYTSLDSSLATTFAGESLLIVCDNTMHAANRRAEASGRQYKAKHTAGSLDVHKITEVQQALSIIHQTADSSIEFFQELAAITVPRKKWIEVMDIIIPRIELSTNASGKVTNKRFVNDREAKRELLDNTYTKDAMANTWVGTGLGVVQAINTYATHYAQVRGNTRVQRNAAKLVDGEFRRIDEKSVAALAAVMDLPELVGAP
jgi:phage/plasmid-like protein (TIGR03299 family)